MQYDWQPKPTVPIGILRELCPLGEYRVYSPYSIPDGIISRELLNKSHSVLFLSSGEEEKRIFIMLNINRVDKNDIDQMPYAIAIDKNQYILSGLLIQHGNYTGRTRPIPPDFVNYLVESGIYPLREMPKNDKGKISELVIESQSEAQRILFEKITVAFPEE